MGDRFCDLKLHYLPDLKWNRSFIYLKNFKISKNVKYFCNFSHEIRIHPNDVSSKPTQKEILWPNVLRFVRSTILESKQELLEKVVKKSHHNSKVYYVNHDPLSFLKFESNNEA